MFANVAYVCFIQIQISSQIYKPLEHWICNVDLQLQHCSTLSRNLTTTCYTLGIVTQLQSINYIMEIETLLTHSSHDDSISIHHLLEKCLQISTIHHKGSAGLSRIADF